MNVLKENLTFFNTNNDNNNSNNIFLPPRPPPSPPPSPPKQDNLFFQPSFRPQQTTPKQNCFGPAPRIPSTPSAPGLPPDDNYFKQIQNLVKLSWHKQKKQFKI